MRHPPKTVERAFELASDMEKQLQVANSFKLDFPAYPSRELNEMSAEETSGDEQEINEISRNRKWVSSSNSYNQNVQILTTIEVTVTDINNSGHKKENKQNSGCKSQRIPKLH